MLKESSHLWAWLCFLFASSVQAIEIKIQAQDGLPLEDAVVELVSASPQTERLTTLSVAQKDLTFVPFVTAVQKGSAIEFPNQDKTRHHVYSFSPAKVFELKLYAGKPEAPVRFEKSGIVALGCNIHDYMQAYVYVGDSPFLAVTNSQGVANLLDIPEGQYQVKLWHPWQQSDPAIGQVSIPLSGEVVFKIDVLRQQKPTKPKKGFGNSY